MHVLKGTLASLHIALNTLFWCIPIYALAIPRFLLPIAAWRRAAGSLMSRAADAWVACNRLVLLRVLRLSRIERTWQLAEPLDPHRWYLVISNHQSWADIFVLQDTFLGRIPPLKFFNKQVLIWVPLIGFAMWLLDFPYVRRYSREALAANPDLRKHDQATTVKACEQFRVRPTSVLNFLEGTRFTEAKHRAQASPFRHLLTPKTGGFGYVRASLGDRIHQVIDATIVYPQGVPTFWDFLCGRCPEARIDVLSVEAPHFDLAHMSDDGLPADLRERLRLWTDTLWARKDARIDELMESG